MLKARLGIGLRESDGVKFLCDDVKFMWIGDNFHLWAIFEEAGMGEASSCDINFYRGYDLPSLYNKCLYIFFHFFLQWYAGIKNSLFLYFFRFGARSNFICRKFIAMGRLFFYVWGRRVTCLSSQSGLYASLWGQCWLARSLCQLKEKKNLMCSQMRMNKTRYKSPKCKISVIDG